MTRTARRISAVVAGLGCLLVATACTTSPPKTLRPPIHRNVVTRYKHIVVDLLENHSFDSILGQYCTLRRTRVDAQPCNGIAIGAPVRLSNGATVRLRAQPDITPDINHEPFAQNRAWRHGNDDGWQQIPGCSPGPKQHYACMELVSDRDIPALATLADASVVADHTLTCDRVPSWADHYEWLSGCDLGDFRGDNPRITTPGASGIGWGCISGRTSAWGPDNVQVPSCFPDYTLNKAAYPFGGAFRETPVQPMHTLAEDCDTTQGCTWRQYGSTEEDWQKGDFGFVWNLASSFAQLTFRNASNTVPADQFYTDAANGALPAITFLTPNVSAGKNSEHNLTSMAFGDSVLAKQFNSLAAGPLAQNTLFLVTYDDCGCLYDHVAPNRVPVVIAGAYTRPGGTDSTRTTFAGIIKMIDETFGLPYQNDLVAGAYSFDGVNDFAASPHALPRLPVRSVPPASMPYVVREVLTRNDNNDS